MQVPFPELTDLLLRPELLYMTINIPDSFLGGSAPRLQRLELNGFPFPGLPKQLLSATHLVELWLSDISHSWYISPEAMVALLSVLSSLRTLFLRFRYPNFRPGWENQSLPPPKHSTILPALQQFYFKGIT